MPSTSSNALPSCTTHTPGVFCGCTKRAPRAKCRFGGSRTRSSRRPTRASRPPAPRPRGQLSRRTHTACRRCTLPSASASRATWSTRCVLPWTAVTLTRRRLSCTARAPLASSRSVRLDCARWRRRLRSVPQLQRGLRSFPRSSSPRRTSSLGCSTRRSLSTTLRLTGARSRSRSAAPSRHTRPPSPCAWPSFRTARSNASPRCDLRWGPTPPPWGSWGAACKAQRLTPSP
mmetsp:Transcript_34754/g.68158  ORF Transcript_34754/g.68158 Transcript_34754/m.68158 type:complete len:231 (+) Transcript_34754:135-827(+)